jgi:hypothetical protein
MSGSDIRTSLRVASAHGLHRTSSSAESRGWPGRSPAMTTEGASPEAKRPAADPTRKSEHGQTVRVRIDALPALASTPLKPPQGKTNFMNNLSPVARSALACSKICLSFFRKSCFLYAIPPHQRGVSRPSRAWSAGCGGRMGLQRGSFRADEHPDAHGQAVWSWHPGADAKLAMTFCGRRGQERRSPRRARSKP